GAAAAQVRGGTGATAGRQGGSHACVDAVRWQRNRSGDTGGGGVRRAADGVAAGGGAGALGAGAARPRGGAAGAGDGGGVGLPKRLVAGRGARAAGAYGEYRDVRGDAHGAGASHTHSREASGCADCGRAEGGALSRSRGGAGRL
ncbi:MAG: hypothetical protein AVDCRST_MAG77-4493, partial [uncultured Chloroflexi bacterium]